MSSKISVIIPIYNSEKYLANCAKSILNQTHKNIELILIDDGSTDASPQICDQLAEHDDRVQVIHKKNGGVSSARNMGIRLSTGDYICFVDSDDTLPQNSLEVRYSVYCKYGVQYVTGCMSNNGKIGYRYTNINKIVDYNQEPMELLRYLTRPGSYSACSGLFERYIIEKNRIFFSENLRIAEDAVFLRCYLCFCDKIALIPEVVYNVDSSNVNSASKKSYKEFCDSFSKKMYVLESLCDVLPIDNNQKKQFLMQRAVHGLRISINHYFTHWSEDTMCRQMIGESINILSPWIFSCSLDKKDSNYIWWNKYKNLLKNKKYNQFYHRIKREHKILKTLRKMKQFVRKCIRNLYFGEGSVLVKNIQGRKNYYD